MVPAHAQSLIAPVKGCSKPHGTIRAAGLLCYDDYVQAVRDYCNHHIHPAALAVPGESFNYLGLDLTGHHYSEIGQTFHLPVALM